ncbi:MAG: hypothetical protein KGP27_03480 [Hyphomicrobiales bacterium]|nr:hypothetical protein [Hyphomicrobiales bacterium]
MKEVRDAFAGTAVERLAIIAAELDAIESGSDSPDEVAPALLRLAEQVLETWIEAHGQVPTQATKEGFRILALHRQGARGDPSFNACRETVRELVYRHNVAREPGVIDAAAWPRQRTLMVMVARHLCLFIEGKLTEAGLGTFCCSAKPMRADASG